MGKRGRKSRNPTGEPTKIVPVRMSDAEHAAYTKAAYQAKETLSGWIRSQLDKAAKRAAK